MAKIEKFAATVEKNKEKAKITFEVDVKDLKRIYIDGSIEVVKYI